MARAFDGGSSEFEELACEGEAYDPARPNDYMEYCKVRRGRDKHRRARAQSGFPCMQPLMLLSSNSSFVPSYPFFFLFFPRYSGTR